MNNLTSISFIIVSHNSYDDLIKFFSTFLAHNVTDNILFKVLETGFDARTKAVGSNFNCEEIIEVEYIENKGYAYACNYGFKFSNGAEIVIFSNPDIIFCSNIVNDIRVHFNRNNYGTIIQRSPDSHNITFDLYPNYKNLFTELVNIHRFINFFNFYHPRVTHIVGAFMIIGKDVFKENTGFDENFFLYYEETDFFYRLRNNNNHKIIRQRHLIHNISTSIDSHFSSKKYELQFASLIYYCKKHRCLSYVRQLQALYKLLSVFKQENKFKLKVLNGLMSKR